MQLETVVPADPYFAKAGFDVLYFPSDTNRKFGTVHVVPKNFDFKKKVKVIIVQLGQGKDTNGDGSLSELTTMMHYAGIYNTSAPGNWCLLNAVLQEKYNCVLVIVQTTEASAYRKGETDLAIDQANSYNIIGKPSMIAISLGGYGLLQSITTKEQAAKLWRIGFLSPGGGGTIGAQFPACVVAAGVDCLFFTSAGDTVTSPQQCYRMDNMIRDLGGKSECVIYANNVHVVTFPMNTYFPNRPFNATDYKLTNESFTPTEDLYSFLCADQPADEKLIGTMLITISGVPMLARLMQDENGYYLWVGDQEYEFEKP